MNGGGGAIERKILLDVDVEGSRTDSCWFCCCSHQKNSILLRGGGGGDRKGFWDQRLQNQIICSIYEYIIHITYAQIMTSETFILQY